VDKGTIYKIKQKGFHQKNNIYNTQINFDFWAIEEHYKGTSINKRSRQRKDNQHTQVQLSFDFDSTGTTISFPDLKI